MLLFHLYFFYSLLLLLLALYFHSTGVLVKRYLLWAEIQWRLLIGGSITLYFSTKKSYVINPIAEGLGKYICIFKLLDKIY